MSKVLFNAKLYELRQQEREAAMIGGKPWASFVRQCERELGAPWNEIRECFERIPVEAQS